jgi:hypothetical protein
MVSAVDKGPSYNTAIGLFGIYISLKFDGSKDFQSGVAAKEVVYVGLFTLFSILADIGYLVINSAAVYGIAKG